MPVLGLMKEDICTRLGQREVFFLLLPASDFLSPSQPHSPSQSLAISSLENFLPLPKSVQQVVQGHSFSEVVTKNII